MKRINWNAIGALITSVCGIAAHPEVMSLLPEKYAIGLSVLGIVWQGFAQSVVKSSTDPK